jgi:hypothetical protein
MTLVMAKALFEIEKNLFHLKDCFALSVIKKVNTPRDILR